jgi:PAS domain S-box-containing protein
MLGSFATQVWEGRLAKARHGPDDELPGRYLVVVDVATTRVLSASEGFAALLGYTPEEMRGRDVWDYTQRDPERRATVERNIAEAPDDFVADVATLVTKDDEEIEVSYTLRKLGTIYVTIVSPLGQEPGLTRLQRVAVDLITRRARLDAGRRDGRSESQASPTELRVLPPSRRKTG